uniref:Uncharacterized protein n=1 Tax=Setaria digitata TaxID=48799 RepID=A0A915PKQ9_9BILA
MLSELFAELVIDFDDSDRAVQTDSCPRFTCASLHAYVPLDRSPKWFLNDNLYLNNNGDDKTSEISRNRAAFAYIHADYITAMDVAPVNGPQLLSLLQKLHTLVSTYDEQLQYWAQSLKVYFAAGTCTKDSLRNAILLCASVDLPEFWISIPKNIPVFFLFPFVNPSTNLRIGSLCRAVHILEKLSPSKAGFLDCNDLQLMKRELHGQQNSGRYDLRIHSSLSLAV